MPAAATFKFKGPLWEATLDLTANQLQNKMDVLAPITGSPVDCCK